MKVKVDEEEEGFNPVTLSVRIESKDELLNLWHRMNAPGGVIEASVEKAADMPSGWGDTVDFWYALDSVLVDRGYRND